MSQFISHLPVTDNIGLLFPKHSNTRSENAHGVFLRQLYGSFERHWPMTYCNPAPVSVPDRWQAHRVASAHSQPELQLVLRTWGGNKFWISLLFSRGVLFPPRFLSSDEMQHLAFINDWLSFLLQLTFTLCSLNLQKLNLIFHSADIAELYTHTGFFWLFIYPGAPLSTKKHEPVRSVFCSVFGPNWYHLGHSFSSQRIDTEHVVENCFDLPVEKGVWTLAIHVTTAFCGCCCFTTLLVLAFGPSSSQFSVEIWGCSSSLDELQWKLLSEVCRHCFWTLLLNVFNVIFKCC